MQEPDFLYQTSEPMTEQGRLEWSRNMAMDAFRLGGHHARVSVHPEIPDLLLVEAWKEAPEDMGEPRWQLGREQPTTN